MNEEFCKSLDRTDTVRNSLDKELQRRLRKRQVSFKSTENFLKSISAGKKQAKSTGSENMQNEAGQEEKVRECETKQDDPAAELKTEV